MYVPRVSEYSVLITSEFPWIVYPKALARGCCTLSTYHAWWKMAGVGPWTLMPGAGGGEKYVVKRREFERTRFLMIV